MKFPRFRLNSSFSLFLVVFICFGYPIQGAIPVLLGINSTSFNLSARLVTSVLMLVLVLGGLLIKDKGILKNCFFLFAFWSLYSIRLFYDLSIIDISCNACVSDITVYGYAFGQCLLPIFVISLYAQKWSYSMVYKYCFYFNLAAGISLAAMFFIFRFDGSLDFLTTRTRITNDPSDINNNRATLGVSQFIVTGFYLAVMSFYNVLLVKRKEISKLFSIFGLICAILLVILGGGRSSAVIMIINFSLTFLLFIWINKFKLTNLLRFLFSSLIVLLIIIYSGLLDTLSSSTIFIRMRGFFRIIGQNENVDEARTTLIESAFSQFLDNPLFGSSIIEKTSSHFPHNVYVESFMACGIFGGIIFIFIIVKCSYKILTSFLSLDRFKCGLSVLCISNLFTISVGGSLWGAPQVWIIFALFICTNKFIKDDSRFLFAHAGKRY